MADQFSVTTSVQLQKPVAFFDIDGTLFRSSLLVEVVEALVEAGIFPQDAEDHYRAQLLDWQNREGSYETYLAAVIESYLFHIKGVHYGAFAEIGQRVVKEQSKRVYRYTRNLISDLRSQGYYLVAISQSPKTILDPFCRQYGFDKVYGRIYEIGPQDRFTGVITDVHIIENKANIVARVFGGNSQLTKAGSIAVGDTESDIPLLEAVERPICFNPNAALLAQAKRCGWETVVERKDVIYHIAA